VFYFELGLDGLASVGAYLLGALGMILVFRASRTVNFSQAAIGMIGALIYGHWVNAGGSVVVAFIVAVVVSAVTGLITYLLFIRPLARRGPFARLVVTFAVLLLLDGIAYLIWGSGYALVQPTFGSGAVHIGTIPVTIQTLVSLGVGIVGAALTGLYFQRTRRGIATQATAVNVDGAEALGVNVTALGSIAWLVAGAISGIALILLLPDVGLQPEPLTLSVLPCLAVALAARFRRLLVAVVVAIVIGVAQSICSGVSSLSQYSDSLPFVAIIAVLLVVQDVRPGRVAQEFDRLVACPTVSGRRVRTGAAGLVVLCILPLVFDQYWVSLLTEGAGLAIVGLSLVLLTGYLGEISLMQWAFAGVGAFMTSYLSAAQHWNVVLALLVSAAIVVPGALLLGAISMRLSGLNLAIASLGCAIVVQDLILPHFNGGIGYGYTALTFGGAALTGKETCYLALAVLIVIVAALVLVRNSTIGARLIAVKGSPTAATAAGISCFRYKVTCMCSAAFMAALGGAIWGYATGSVNSSTFDPVTSLSILVFVYINGIGLISGGIIGGLAVALGPSFLTGVVHISGLAWFYILGGGLAAISVVHQPDGALYRPGRRKTPRFSRAPGSGHPSVAVKETI
jgi:branched-subunit amino acid ABC-type transport system permease component